ncbi:MAG: HEAT repeat domain-containing protein, partial [Pseudanabaenaceae cyanobacterium]
SDTLPWLKDRALNDQNKYVRSAAVQEIAQGWKDDSDTLPWLKDCALNDQNEYVRRAAVQEIAQGWKDDLQTSDFLCDRAIHDPFKRTESWETNPRQAALEAIL